MQYGNEDAKRKPEWVRNTNGGSASENGKGDEPETKRNRKPTCSEPPGRPAPLQQPLHERDPAPGHGPHVIEADVTHDVIGRVAEPRVPRALKVARGRGPGEVPEDLHGHQVGTHFCEETNG